MQSLTIIAEVADGIGMFGFAVAGLFRLCRPTH